MKRLFLAIMVLSFLTLAGCSPAPAASSGAIQVLSPWALAANSGDNTAIFMLIKNNGSQPDQLIKAETEGSMMVGLHQTVMKDNVMTMPDLAAIDVPANGQVELKAGSYHVMAMGLNKDLKAGDKLRVHLTFAKAGVISLDADVRTP
jgi:copper(I)-binding protein